MFFSVSLLILGCFMSFELSSKSLSRLEGVHPDLVAVVKRAIELTPIDFGVSEGVSTYARQVQLLDQKKTTTLHSQHLLQDETTGYGHAVDVFAYMNGKAVWKNEYYGPIVQAFFTAAIELGIQIDSGHLWKSFKDSVHIQLNPEHYT